MIRLANALEEAGHVSPGQTWQALTGGRTNRLWRVQDHVVKLFAPTKNPLFPNEPDAEWAILTELEGSGVTPRPVHSGNWDGCRYIVYEFQNGHAWEQGVSQPAGVLRRIHGVSAQNDYRLAPDGSAALVAQTNGILNVLDASARDRLLLLRPDGVVAPSMRRSLLHGDPVPANFIIGDASVLVDWQCPAIGDPVEDLCMFLSPAMQLAYRGAPLEADEIQDFLAKYDCTDTAKRLAFLAPWHHWRMAAYCAWKSATDPIYTQGMGLELAALNQVSR